MATKSLADSIQARLQADTPSTSTNLSDLEWNFYSPQSGLTPASKYSITDHKLAYYKLQGAYSGSIRDIELAYFKSQGAVGGSYHDIAYDFYANRQFFLPNALANLELWLEADNVSGAVLASDNFDRSKNLLAGNDPSFETGIGSWVVSFNPGTYTTSLVRSTAQAHSGSGSLLLTTTTGGASQLNVADTTNKKSVVAGTTYTASLYTYLSRSQQVWCVISWYTTGGAYISSSTTTTNPTASAWTRISAVFAAPVSAASAIIEYVAAAPGAGDLFYIDDVQLEQGSKATAFVWGDATHLGTTDQGQAWTVTTGGAGISGGVATYSVAPTIATIDTGILDTDVSIVVDQGAGTPTAGLVVRHVDDSNYIHVRFLGGAVDVVRFVASASQPSDLNTGNYTGRHTLRATVVGALLTVYVDGVQVGTVTLTGSFVTTGTRVGYRATSSLGATFDNFSVKTPIYSDGAALPVWPDKSGYGRHAKQATVASQPLWRRSNINLLPYATATAEVALTPFTGSNATVTLDTGTKRSGAQSIKAVASATTGVNIQIGSNNTTRAPVVPGQTYTASMYVNVVAAGAPTSGVNASIQWFDSSNNYITGHSGNPTLVTGAFTRITDSDVAPANAVFANVALNFLGTIVSASSTVYIDDVQIELGASATTWLPPVTLPNSKPAVQFDGLDDNLSGTINTPGGDVDSTVLVAYRSERNPAATVQVAFAYGAFAGTRTTPHLGLGGSANSGLWGTAADDLSAALTDPTQWHSQGWGHSTGNTTLTAWQDGAVKSTKVLGGVMAVPADTSTSVGSWLNSSSPLNGSIACILVFSRALSTTERQQVERYLRNKYALP